MFKIFTNFFNYFGKSQSTEIQQSEEMKDVEFKNTKDFSEEPSVGQMAIAKILEMAELDDLRITPYKYICAVKNGKNWWVFSKNISNLMIRKTDVCDFKDDRSISWKDLSPNQCDKLVLESLCGSFVGHFSKGVVAIPNANSLDELMTKLDTKQSIFIAYEDLNLTYDSYDRPTSFRDYR